MNESSSIVEHELKSQRNGQNRPERLPEQKHPGMRNAAKLCNHKNNNAYHYVSIWQVLTLGTGGRECKQTKTN